MRWTLSTDSGGKLRKKQQEIPCYDKTERNVRVDMEKSREWEKLRQEANERKKGRMTGRREGSGGRSGRSLRRGSGDRKLRGGREEVESLTEPEHSGWDNTHKHIDLKDNASPTVFLSDRQWGRDQSCSVNMSDQLDNGWSVYWAKL